jgi:hypothetical protein
MKTRMRPDMARFAWLLALAVTGGCALNGGYNPRTAVAPVENHQEPDLSPIIATLDTMSSLPAGDPAKQAELFQSVKDAAELTPTTSNKLKYALALATPGHSGTDPVAAQRQLSELLARPETLLPIERLLALVELRDVEELLILQSENKRLSEEATRDSREKLQTVNRRLSTEQDENVRLRKALDEARAKREAVTHIERSINDRDATAAH